MSSPQRRRIVALSTLIAAVLAVTVFLIPALLPVELRDQWEWTIVGLQGLVTVAMVTYLVWFVRKQRDDYWLERGKDPKHPEL